MECPFVTMTMPLISLIEKVDSWFESNMLLLQMQSFRF